MHIQQAMNHDKVIEELMKRHFQNRWSLMELSIGYYGSIKGSYVVQLEGPGRVSDVSNLSYKGRKGIIPGKEDNLREDMFMHKQRYRNWKRDSLGHFKKCLLNLLG